MQGGRSKFPPSSTAVDIYRDLTVDLGVLHQREHGTQRERDTDGEGESQRVAENTPDPE